MPKVSDTLFLTRPFIPCPTCNFPDNPFPAAFPFNYFQSVPSICTKCNNAIDWWAACLSTLNSGTGLFSQGVAAALGAKSSLIMAKVPLLGHVEIALSDYHVPEDSIILYVNYTVGMADHPYIPLNWHGGEPFSSKIPRKLFIYGFPARAKDGMEFERKYGDLTVMVTYIPHSKDDHALKNLGKAYRYFLEGDYEEMVIPAHVAVEDTLKQWLDQFCKYSGVKNAEQKWDTMLNHTLPLALDRCNFPRIKKPILDSVNKLYGLRNMLAHQGRISGERPLLKEAAAERLCSAIFLTRYLLLLNNFQLPVASQQ